MDKFKVGLQYWIPQHGLTRLMGKLASAKAGGLTTAVIRWFIKQYNAASATWITQPTNLYSSNAAALAGLDASGGGINLALGQIGRAHV